MDRIFNQVKSMKLFYIIQDGNGPEVTYVAGPFSDMETALDHCIEIAYHSNKKYLEVLSQEVFVK